MHRSFPVLDRNLTSRFPTRCLQDIYIRALVKSLSKPPRALSSIMLTSLILKNEPSGQEATKTTMVSEPLNFWPLFKQLQQRFPPCTGGVPGKIAIHATGPQFSHKNSVDIAFIGCIAKGQSKQGCPHFCRHWATAGASGDLCNVDGLKRRKTS